MVSSEQQLTWMRECMARDAGELMRRYAAHSLGIGRLIPDDERDERLALLFYVDPGAAASAEPVPPDVEYLPPDRTEPVTLPTRVVDSAPAEFE